jgi:hypothetical protein
MSFWSDLGKVVLAVAPVVIGIATGGGSILATMATTAVAGYVLSKVVKSTSPTTTTKTDNLVQIPPAQDNHIPVIYGRAMTGGIVTEAVMSNNNQIMTYVFTISETTGNLFSTGQPSTYAFNNVYISNSLVQFQTDGVTVSAFQDHEGTLNTSPNGLIKIWCYAGGSGSQYQLPVGGSTISTVNAYDQVPNWTSAMNMSNLVFAIVQVSYDSSKGVTGIPTMLFDITNSMTLPGDCIADYATNTIYGAGISLTDIYVS